MKPGLTIDGAKLTSTEEATNRHTPEVPSGHAAVMIGLTKEPLAPTQTAKQKCSLGLINRMYP